MKRELGIYVHIPFCARKCAYCDFLSFPAGRSVQERYFTALNREIEAFDRAKDYEAVSVYFGGGTPSLPEPSHITQTLDTIRSVFSVREDAEITIECNPGTLDEGKLRAYRGAGFNRLSLGLQTSDNALLKKLGRIHTWERFCEEYRLARLAGFTNISVDLMYALPGQTCEGWRETVEKVLNLPNPPSDAGDSRETAADDMACRAGTGEAAEDDTACRADTGEAAEDDTACRAGAGKAEEGVRAYRACGPEHISAYSLIIEEGTPFWEQFHEDAEARARGDDPLFLPSEEEEDRMLADLKQLLQERGMHRYEISNYAVPGRESRHNTGYWIRREYAGFGLGASGQLGRERIRNTADPEQYLSDAAAGRTVTPLSEKDEMEETMFLGLRRMEGVDLNRFARTFGVRAEEIYGPVIEAMTANGLIETVDCHLRLTGRGVDLSNLVMAQFLLD